MTLIPDNSLNTLFLAIIGFFLIRYIKRNDKKLDKFIEAVTEVSKQIAVVITNFDNKDKNCAAVHKIIAHDFEKLENKIESIEKEINNSEKK